MFTIILPTYNERENLENFVGALLAVFRGNGLSGRILIVDDSSRSEERRVGKECRSRWSPYH